MEAELLLCNYGADERATEVDAEAIDLRAVGSVDLSARTVTEGFPTSAS